MCIRDRNEIAQSEAATGKPFVKYWIHNEWLLVEGKKMSKSLGNILTLKDLTSKGYKAREVRLVLLSTHYRQQLNFTWHSLDAAKHALSRLDEFYTKLSKYKAVNINEDKKNKQELNVNQFREKFFHALLDDLNFPKALACLFELIAEINKLMDTSNLDARTKADCLKFLEEFELISGIQLKLLELKKIPDEIKRLVEEREKARKQRDFEKADKLRAKLLELGWLIEDTSEGPRVKRVNKS